MAHSFIPLQTVISLCQDGFRASVTFRARHKTQQDAVHLVLHVYLEIEIVLKLAQVFDMRGSFIY